MKVQSYRALESQKRMAEQVKVVIFSGKKVEKLWVLGGAGGRFGP